MSDRTHVLFWAAIVAGALLQGCTAFPQRNASLANPTPLHRQGEIPVPADPDNIEHQAVINYRELPLRYYRALDEAKKLPPAEGAIDAYVKAGTALVELDCLRWFARVADAQRGLT